MAGVQPCSNRCAAGFRKCPRANSAFEEFCIYNPERIDQIEIIDGPSGLVGFGRQFWAADQAARDAAHAEKAAEFERWEAEHPDMTSDYRAKTQYFEAISSNQTRVAMVRAVRLFDFKSTCSPLDLAFSLALDCCGANNRISRCERCQMGQDTAAAAARDQFAGDLVR